MNIKKIDIKEFRDKGILQEINRQFLHPLGLALEVVIDDEDPSKVTLGGIWDYREDEEGILFAEAKLEDSEFLRKIEVFNAFQKKQHDRRHTKLGYVIQTPPEQ